MDWFKKHTDVVIVLGGIISSIMWMNHQFNKVNDRFNTVNDKFFSLEKEINERFVALEKDVAIIKAVLVIQGHLPKELAANIEVE